MTSNIPPLINKGDEIRIISTARKITLNEIKPAVDFIKSNGFNVSFGANLFKEQHQFAGNDDQRAADLQAALDNFNVKVIWMARGGYGTHRIIEKIKPDAFSKNPKWIVGYSDVTVLHAFVFSQTRIATLHATMPVNFKNQTLKSFKMMLDFMKGKTAKYKIKTDSFNRTGEAKGVLWGGNLSIIYSLTGTKYLPALEGVILFIEDLDEYLYHVDRMMMSLKLAGVFDKIAGLIVGGMSDMNDNRIPFGRNAKEIIQENVKSLDFPVLYNFPAGHQKSNLPLIFGSEINLKVGENNSSVTFIAPFS